MWHEGNKTYRVFSDIFVVDVANATGTALLVLGQLVKDVVNIIAGVLLALTLPALALRLELTVVAYKSGMSNSFSHGLQAALHSTDHGNSGHPAVFELFICIATILPTSAHVQSWSASISFCSTSATNHYPV